MGGLTNWPLSGPAELGCMPANIKLGQLLGCQISQILHLLHRAPTMRLSRPADEALSLPTPACLELMMSAA